MTEPELDGKEDTRTLMQRLRDAKLAGHKTSHGYWFNTNEQAAENALEELEQLFRERADSITLAGDIYKRLSDRRAAGKVAEFYRQLADEIAEMLEPKDKRPVLMLRKVDFPIG